VRHEGAVIWPAGRVAESRLCRDGVELGLWPDSFRAGGLAATPFRAGGLAATPFRAGGLAATPFRAGWLDATPRSRWPGVSFNPLSRPFSAHSAPLRAKIFAPSRPRAFALKCLYQSHPVKPVQCKSNRVKPKPAIAHNHNGWCNVPPNTHYVGAFVDNIAAMRQNSQTQSNPVKPHGQTNGVLGIWSNFATHHPALRPVHCMQFLRLRFAALCSLCSFAAKILFQNS
jgi:hypothetical protein